jgi:hypothetical protein
MRVKHRVKAEPRWKVDERLERALLLTDAIGDYHDATVENNKTWIAETAGRLRDQFGMSSAEMKALARDHRLWPYWWRA